MLNTIDRFVRRVVTAEQTATLQDVVRMMDRHNVGAVVVVEQSRPVGIITDRDLALELGARGISPRANVVTIMSMPPTTVRADDSVLTVTQAMREAQVRRLPVIDADGNLVGIVTADELLGLLGREMSNLVEGIAPEMAVR